MVPPAVLLPWAVLALLGAEGGCASQQEGKGGLLRGSGWGPSARGAGGQADGRTHRQLVPPLSLVPRSNSEAFPELRAVPAAEPEPQGGIWSPLPSSEAGHGLAWVSSAHAS